VDYVPEFMFDVTISNLCDGPMVDVPFHMTGIALVGNEAQNSFVHEEKFARTKLSSEIHLVDWFEDENEEAPGLPVEKLLLSRNSNPEESPQLSKPPNL
jgi:hypothetical protein